MGSAGAAGDDEPQRERIEGVRVPCWDAKRRVWRAIELLERERRTALSSSKPTAGPDRKEATGR